MNNTPGDVSWLRYIIFLIIVNRFEVGVFSFLFLYVSFDEIRMNAMILCEKYCKKVLQKYNIHNGVIMPIEFT